MTAKYTAGPVYVVSVVEKDHERPPRTVHNIFNRDGLYAHIAECGNADNARRIVAAWNACQGIPTAALESQQSGGLPWSVAYQIQVLAVQKDLLDALKSVEDQGYDMPMWLSKTVRAAIAKATGEKA